VGKGDQGTVRPPRARHPGFSGRTQIVKCTRSTENCRISAEVPMCARPGAGSLALDQQKRASRSRTRLIWIQRKAFVTGRSASPWRFRGSAKPDDVAAAVGQAFNGQFESLAHPARGRFAAASRRTEISSGARRLFVGAAPSRRMRRVRITGSPILMAKGAGGVDVRNRRRSPIALLSGHSAGLASARGRSTGRSAHGYDPSLQCQNPSDTGARGSSAKHL